MQHTKAPDGLEILDPFINHVLTKYQHGEFETWFQIASRMSVATHSKFFKYIFNKVLFPQGSILYGLGRPGALPEWSTRKDDIISISLSNCVVQTLREDSMSDIMLTGARSAKCYQYRMGVGTDLSELRPRGCKVRNAAKTSSGAASFMEYFSTVCGAVGQQGRRGALMLTIDVSHPDVEEFILMKQEAAKVLNANVSVKISDAFMKAVHDDAEFNLEWRGDIYKTVRAKSLWDKILNSAYKCAEPGVLFWDRVMERPHGFYPGARPVTTNPCSEIPLPDDDVCLLTSIYLPYFVKNPYTDEAYFDYDEFKKVVQYGIEFLDIVKDYDIRMVPSEAIKQQSIDWRRIGLGTHGLGDTFWRLGLTYGSADSLIETNKIYETLMKESYRQSIQLAKELKPFPKYSYEIEDKCEWLKDRLEPEDFENLKKYGRRNLHCNTIAPTGSISVLSDNCSSGIEPPHSLEYDRFCLGKQYKSIKHGEWLKFQQITGETVPRPHMVCSHEVSPEARVEVQAAATYWLDHSASSTVNFLHGTEIEDIEKVYLNAWKSGCEGITVYVQGSREDIVSVQNIKKKRPIDLDGITQKFGEGDLVQYVTVNKDSRGNIVEIFVNNLNPKANLGIDDSMSNLYKLGSDRGLINHFYEYDNKITIDQKLALFTTILLRCGVNISEILNCFSDTIAGSLPFYIKVAIMSNVPESMIDISCAKGNCG